MEGGRGGRVEADAATDHLPVRVFDNEARSVREGRLRTERLHGPGAGDGRHGTESKRHHGHSERDAYEAPHHVHGHVPLRRRAPNATPAATMAAARAAIT